ncbi:DUF3467 domain-containing protein [Azospirillum sp. sgz302134]
MSDVRENGATADVEQVVNETEQTVRVRFDDSNMSTHYANVANVGMSKDELTLLFGTNQTWGSIGSEIEIKLSNRIIMTPSVAKNLAETLKRVLAEYEEKVGKIV